MMPRLKFSLFLILLCIKMSNFYEDNTIFMYPVISRVGFIKEIR